MTVTTSGVARAAQSTCAMAWTVVGMATVWQETVFVTLGFRARIVTLVAAAASRTQTVACGHRLKHFLTTPAFSARLARSLASKTSMVALAIRAPDCASAPPISRAHSARDAGPEPAAMQLEEVSVFPTLTARPKGPLKMEASASKGVVFAGRVSHARSARWTGH